MVEQIYIAFVLNMNWCGWTTTEHCFQNPFPPRLGFIQPMSRPYNDFNNANKISVKGSDMRNQKVTYPLVQSKSGFDTMNQTLPSNSISYSNWGQKSIHNPEIPTPLRRKNSIIDRINDNQPRQQFRESNCRSALPRQQNAIQASNAYPYTSKPTMNSMTTSSHYGFSDTVQRSYAELLRENMELKRVVNQEYLPLKQMYTRLKQEHDDREFLVSKLEWKVRQLAKQMKNKRN